MSDKTVSLSVWKNDLPKIGVRPTIDGRLGGVRESLEEQTMQMDQGMHQHAQCDHEQVLDNIYSNAVKYSPDGGLIETEVQPNGEYVDITIRDNGLGMTGEEVSRVFDKFYRADASNTAISGTGLGMSIVRHILEAHGGQVSVSSEKGVGTAVLMRIPRAADTEMVETDAGAPKQQLPICDIAS